MATGETAIWAWLAKLLAGADPHLADIEVGERCATADGLFLTPEGVSVVAVATGETAIWAWLSELLAGADPHLADIEVGETCAASQQQKIHLNKQHCCISVRLHVQIELTKLLSGADPDLELRTERW